MGRAKEGEGGREEDGWRKESRGRMGEGRVREDEIRKEDGG